MPLKRRRVDAEATNSEKNDEDDSDGQEPRRSLYSKKKRSVAYVPIVISDSDGEMQEEKKEEQRKKVKKQSVCSKLEAKRRIAQMSEEEQLELAVKMSEQEASQANYQQDKEEELLKKAIAESLSSQCVEETPDGSAVNEDDIDGEPMQDSSSDSALSGEVQESQELVRTQEQEEEEKEEEGEEQEEEEEEEQQQQQEEEEDLTVCPETQPSLASDTDAERRDIPLDESRSPFQSGPGVLAEEPKSMEPIMAEVEPTMSDLEPAVTDVEPSIAEVQCPLCGQGFAVEEIERHAADCDGHTEPLVGRQKVSVVTRRQRGVKSTPLDMGDLLSSIETGKRKSLFESTLSPQFPSLGKCEKCYVCKELVPMRQYKGHVDLCLQTADLETQGSRRLRNTKEVGRSEGRLLSLLDQSESMSADAETRTSVQRLGAERLHPYEGDEEEEADDVHSSKEPSSPDDFTSQLNISNSPIKSFVSISEATDCLVDFKQQFSKAPGRGRSRGPSRGTSKRSRNRGWRGKRR
ncbi:BRCA1-A complex subunit RAP80 isoform X2 [Ambystoma mexicanum]|uniref:BRCA1-A complex subunit RAP80 isoform X2 n=1 Tax=Ambystoma mexicanum TaxID=8296 RepID=UPI0037E8CF72